jgi:Mg2+-importing ATPase
MTRHEARPGRVWIPLVCGIALVVAVVLVVVNRSEAREFADLIERASPMWLIVAALLQLGTYVAQAEAWWVVLKRPGAGSLRGELVKLSVAKLFVDQVLPSASVSGSAIMAKGLGRLGIAQGVVMATIVVETVAYYIGYSVALLAAVALMLAGRHVSMPILIASAIVVVITVLLVVVMHRMAQGRAPRLPRGAMRIPGLGAIDRALARADPDRLSDRGQLVGATAWQFGIHLLDAMTVWVLLRAVGVSPPPVAVFTSFMLASLARTVGIVPGGLGTFEAVSVTTLRAAGVSLPAALAATLLFRGLSFWLPMIPGWWLTRAEARAAGRSR